MMTDSFDNRSKSVSLKPPRIGRNLYEAVNQTVKVPDGLLYRGKYCGKSQYQSWANQFGVQRVSIGARAQSRRGGG